MASPGLVEFREGSLIYAPETIDYHAAYGILYRHHTAEWYVFWSDTGCNHSAHKGTSAEACSNNFEAGTWELISY